MRHLSLLSTGDDSSGTGVREPEVRSNGRHVLVVDDGAFSRRLTRRRLEAAGFTVTFAEHVLDAGPVDAIASTLEMFLALAPGEGVDALPIVVTTPGDEGDLDEALLDLAADRGATRVVPAADIADAVLEALWELPLTDDDRLCEMDQRRT